MITNYPDKNSLKEALSTELSTSAIRQVCKKNGVFLLSSKKDEVVNTAHLFYWGFSDINSISQLMEDSRNYKKSFRLLVEKKEDFTIDEESSLFNDFFSLAAAYRSGDANKNGIIFKSFVIEKDHSQSHLKAEVEYTRKRKGRVKLMDEVTHRFSFDAYEEDDKILVDVIFDDRNSIQVARKVIVDAISKVEEFSVPKQISLKSLTTDERVELFDQFFAYHLNNWRIDSVKSIKVQRFEDYELEDDEEAEEVESDFLTGIESALLSGSGLRTNPIVVDAVNKGYFFPKATVMLEHRIDALKLLLDISFNTDDLTLELSVVTTYEIEEERSYKRPIPPEDQEDALQYFHSVIAEIFSGLLSKRNEQKGE